MKGKSKVYIVTSVHNRRHFTEPFLGCLHQQKWPNLKIIIVDDGSTDGTSEMIREKFPQVILLHGDGNLWWTAATNVGIREALKTATDSDYVLVINDDLEVNPDYVTNLASFANKHPRSLVGSVIVDFDNQDLIDDGGITINWWTAKYRIFNRGRRLSEFAPGHWLEVSTLTGRGILVPVSAFHELGLYDEKHFINCGDLELPVRSAWKGYRLYVIYNAIVKSHVDAVQGINRRKTYKLKEAKEFFFGIKSYARLKYRFYFAQTAARGNPLKFLSYLSFDLARKCAHFLIRLKY